VALLHTCPAGHAESAVHPWHVWLETSQVDVFAPPAPPQSASDLQPGTHAPDAGEHQVPTPHAESLLHPVSRPASTTELSGEPASELVLLA
jgi:hypothetical protein